MDEHALHILGLNTRNDWTHKDWAHIYWTCIDSAYAACEDVVDGVELVGAGGAVNGLRHNHKAHLPTQQRDRDRAAEGVR